VVRYLLISFVKFTKMLSFKKMSHNFIQSVLRKTVIFESAIGTSDKELTFKLD